ncbi:Uncharacterized protein QTN25_010659 [Entamoeba marina]
MSRSQRISAPTTTEYIDLVQHIVSQNEGNRDCKPLSIDSDNTPCPINGTSQTTDVKITDDSLDIINIDKGFITAHMRYKVRLNCSYSYVTPVDNEGIENFYKIFIGFKSGTQMLDQYRIKIINGGMTGCSQNDAIYENTIVRAQKSKHEVKHRPNMYTTWENANNFSQDVCGCYVNAIDLINTDTWIEFDVTMQYDDFLPLSNMTLYPQYALGGLKMEIKNRITGNLVWCQVDPCVIARKAIKQGAMTLPTANRTYSSGRAMTVLEHEYASIYPAQFTQIGDPSEVYWCVNDTVEDSWKKTGVTLICSDVQMTECKANIFGYNLKSSVKDSILNKCMNTIIRMPAQFIQQDTFSQIPSSTGIKCNANLSLYNCTNIIFGFPRSSNEITVSKNPHQANIIAQIAGRNFPDKAYSTTFDPIHCESQITNAGLTDYDGICPTEAFTNSLRFNEITDDDSTLPLRPMSDNTDYFFNCNLERFGIGVYFDGLFNGNAQVNLTSGHMAGKNSGNPYANPSFSNDVDDRSANTNNIIIYELFDAYWIFNPARRDIQFVYNNSGDS